MLNLEQNEKVLLILHHHWIAFLGPLAIAAALFLIPFFVFPFLSASLLTIFLFATCIWYLIVLFMVLAFWIDYYLDALIVTDRRILNVDQTGLFRHVVSEFRLERVQDVTIEVPNFTATIFHYGNIEIQTAGETSFSIKEVPHPHLARDLILKYARQSANP